MSAIRTAAGMLLFTSYETDRLVPKQFLLMKHYDRWDLPKGHSEPNETLPQTALRETHEETGIHPEEIRWIEGFQFYLEYPVVYRKPKRFSALKQLTYFAGWLQAPVQIVCTEHQGYQWFDWSPPHRIQSQTIDPLLASMNSFFLSQSDGDNARA